MLLILDEQRNYKYYDTLEEQYNYRNKNNSPSLRLVALIPPIIE